MLLIPKKLDNYLLQTYQTVSPDRQAQILAYFAEEPGDGHTWSERDIWEQVRKMIR